MKYLVLILMILSEGKLFAQDSLNLPPPADTNKPIQVIPPRRVPRKPAVQQTDTTTALIDSTAAKDSPQFSVRPLMLADTNLVFPSWASTAARPFFRFTDPLEYSITVRQWEGKEAMFYSIVALLIFFALIKNGFYRYIQDLFSTFFRTTIKQRQIKDQLLQSPIPSLLLNIFFLLSLGMFLSLLLQYFKLALELNFWLLFAYCMLGLIGIYGIKYLTLKLLGWIFQVSDVIDGYIFIVFTTNKVIGMAVLPFLVILAFTDGMINEAAMSLSIMVVVALFSYRFFLSYVSIRRQINISFFHFFLYLCAFEVAPLLLINKLLFRFLGETS